MHDLFAQGGVDRAVGALATRQFGLVTRAQLLAMGVDKGVVDELIRALREAEFLRLFDLDAMRAAIGRRPCRAMRVLIEDMVVTQSGLEDRLLEICDRSGIERPLTQQPLLGHRVDFLWPRERVVVEADGWQAHGTRDAFQADRVTANALQLRGYRILRFTSADLARRPSRTARQIRAALGT